MCLLAVRYLSNSALEYLSTRLNVFPNPSDPLPNATRSVFSAEIGSVSKAKDSLTAVLLLQLNYLSNAR